MEPVEPLGLVAGRWAHVAIRADARDLPFPLPSPSEVFQGSTPCFFWLTVQFSSSFPGAVPGHVPIWDAADVRVGDAVVAMRPGSRPSSCIRFRSPKYCLLSMAAQSARIEASSNSGARPGASYNLV